jgi:hypothetical protein
LIANEYVWTTKRLWMESGDPDIKEQCLAVVATDVGPGVAREVLAHVEYLVDPTVVLEHCCEGYPGVQRRDWLPYLGRLHCHLFKFIIKCKYC